MRSRHHRSADALASAWRGPGRALSRALVLVAALLAGACGERGVYPQPTNLLLVTIDTLRADHLSCYGYPRPTSPVIDRLAAEGVRFDQTAVQWPKTGPSFASIFTATYPKDNGIVRKIGIPLPQGFRMLAEVLREHGYSTHAVVSNGAVASDFNFDQGFDTYVESWKLPAAEGPLDPNRADVVNDLAKAVADGIDRSRPYFLWVHYLDPHFPYTPPAPWSAKFQNDEHFDRGTLLEVDPTKRRKQVGGIGLDQVLSGRRDLAFYVARYDAEIAYNDEKLGELLAYLRDQGLLERTLTALTSDHGESLGEHAYYFDHGRFSFQTTLRVPLLFHYPGVLEPRVDADPVELIDLAPTLLEAAGVPLEAGAWMQGRSLTPRLLGREPSSGGPVYARSEAGYGTKGRWQKVVRDRRHKLIYAPFEPDQRWISRGPRPYFALFDLVEDPDEENDLTEELPEVLDRLQEEMLRWWQPNSFQVVVDESAVEERDEMAAETREQLKALGYLQ